MPKYNIALIPIRESDRVVDFVKENFASIADKYQLGEKSFPHVTLCQFMAEESDLLTIWDEVCQSLKQQSVELEFTKFSSMTVGNSFWVSLLPHDSSALHDMYKTVSHLVKNPIKNALGYYDPHMTLINTKEEKFEEIVNQLAGSYTPIKDTFVVALGKSDDLGQLTEVISCCAI